MALITNHVMSRCGAVPTNESNSIDQQLLHPPHQWAAVLHHAVPQMAILHKLHKAIQHEPPKAIVLHELHKAKLHQLPKAVLDCQRSGSECLL